MTGLNIIAPKNKPGSKCWQVFTPLLQGWHGSSVNYANTLDARPMCIWGLGFDNKTLAQRCMAENKPWLFADMPYFNRWMGEHTAEHCYWRLIPNDLHAHELGSYPNDRADSLGIQLQDWRKNGQHILIAPSSDTVTRFVVDPTLSDVGWVHDVTSKLSSLTDRPWRVRHKPRKGKRSGPMVETTPIENDLKDCWAVVTSCSIVGVQAAIAGIPVFCHPRSPAAPVGNLDITQIEKPHMPERQAWINTLAYRQFTKAEMSNGLAKEILYQLL